MSRETAAWLNRNVLVGNTDQRGHAWHFRASEQGGEPNHYPGFIPVEDVKRRLFNFHAVQAPAYVGIPVLDSDGEPVTREVGKDENDQPIEEPVYKPVIDPDRRYVIASDTHEVLGNASDEWSPHQYDEWLLENVANVLDDDLGISSAGLLQNRAVAWVEVSMPENRSVEGLEYRPNLLATTSFNQTVATQYKRTLTATVCDNTLNAALAESGPTYKLKHTKDSGFKVMEAREALAVIVGVSEEFESAIKNLTDVKISDSDWEQMLEELFPEGTTPTGITRARANRAKLDHLWRFDSRVTPWKGTGLGAYQAWNTAQTHHRQAYGSTNLVERQMFEVITGKTEKLDAPMIQAIDKLRESQQKVSVAVSGVELNPEPEAAPEAAPEKAPAKRARKTTAKS